MALIAFRGAFILPPRGPKGTALRKISLLKQAARIYFFTSLLQQASSWYSTVGLSPVRVQQKSSLELRKSLEKYLLTQKHTFK
jgi:hypothetical protein